MRCDSFEVLIDMILLSQGTTMWKARSILERCLLIICAVLLLTIIVLAIVISSKNGWDEAQILHVAPHGDGTKMIMIELCRRFRSQQFELNIADCLFFESILYRDINSKRFN